MSIAFSKCEETRIQYKKRSSKKQKTDHNAERSRTADMMGDKAKDCSRGEHHYFLYPKRLKIPRRDFCWWERTLNILAGLKRIKHLKKWHSFILELLRERKISRFLAWCPHSNSSNQRTNCILKIPSLKLFCDLYNEV